MTIKEPTTMITDYLITITGGILAVILTMNHDLSLDLGIWAIIGVFISTAFSALLGGTSHGFVDYLTEEQNKLIWKITLILLGVSSVFFVIAAALSGFISGNSQQIFILFGLLQFISYVKWIRQNDEFIYAIVNYALSMLMVVGIKLYSLVVYSDPSSLWIILSVLTTLVGSSVQALKISINDDWFNHNDLFHVIQLFALYFLYIAATKFTVLS